MSASTTPPPGVLVVLVGFMGAGKTTVGRLVARQLGCGFCDSDDVIEQRTGRRVREIFATDGEAAFREIEHAEVTRLVRHGAGVVALGGGAAMDARTQEVLGAVDVVHLRVDLRRALDRVGGDQRRPMLHRPDLGAVYAARVPVYQRLAALTVDVNDRDPVAVAAEVVRALRARAGRPGAALRADPGPSA